MPETGGRVGTGENTEALPGPLVAAAMLWAVAGLTSLLRFAEAASAEEVRILVLGDNLAA